jgi:acyl carrier protein
MIVGKPLFPVGEKRMSDIADRVMRVISQVLSASEAKVVPSAHLVKDLGADSLDSIELLLSLEEEFKVLLTDAQVDAIETVADTVATIEAVAA